MARKTAIERVSALIAGRGPERITLTLKEVEPCREALAALIKGTTVGYSHDPFRDVWLLTRVPEPAPQGFIQF